MTSLIRTLFYAVGMCVSVGIKTRWFTRELGRQELRISGAPALPQANSHPVGLDSIANPVPSGAIAADRNCEDRRANIAPQAAYKAIVERNIFGLSPALVANLQPVAAA